MQLFFFLRDQDFHRLCDLDIDKYLHRTTQILAATTPVELDNRGLLRLSGGASGMDSSTAAKGTKFLSLPGTNVTRWGTKFNHPDRSLAVFVIPAPATSYIFHCIYTRIIEPLHLTLGRKSEAKAMLPAVTEFT
jgi:hypothetical protein